MFELVKGSAGYTFSNLVDFSTVYYTMVPLGALIADANGDLFGTTLEGGAHGVGTVFELMKGSAGYTFTTLYSFWGAQVPRDR